METTPSVTETEQITSSLTEATSQPTENATTVLETSTSMTVTTVTSSLTDSATWRQHHGDNTISYRNRTNHQQSC